MNEKDILQSRTKYKPEAVAGNSESRLITVFVCAEWKTEINQESFSKTKVLQTSAAAPPALMFLNERAPSNNTELAKALAVLGYPKFAHLTKGKIKNPFKDKKSV